MILLDASICVVNQGEVLSKLRGKGDELGLENHLIQATRPLTEASLPLMPWSNACPTIPS